MPVMPRTIELLAPAGKWDTMVRVLAAGADAVYLGGKRFNMRMLRADYNFSDDELKAAVSYCHEREKKIYLTLNNLFYQQELAPLEDYLGWLGEIGVDAVIVQDLAVASLARRAAPHLHLHASVQMGIANSAAADWLVSRGFSRAILSKNVNRAEIAAIHQASKLELEYFIHGDVCISHTGQCYMSTFIFGESGNRGRCKKPCRWIYSMRGEQEYPQGYYLAHQDLCMVDDLSALLEAGVVSLKIEGRMRDADYLARIVGTYRQALQALEQGEKLAESAREDLLAGRIRDFTTAGFTHRPTVTDIGFSGEREPFFPTTPIALTPGFKPGTDPARTMTAEMQVVVDNEAALNSALAAGVKTIILADDDSSRAMSLDLADAAKRVVAAGGEIIYQLPRAVTEGMLSRLKILLQQLQDADINVVLVSDVGSMNLAQNQGFRVWGDFSLNITNAASADWLMDQGLERVTASLELPEIEMEKLLTAARVPIDIMVHGWLPGIMTDLCLRQMVGNECPLQGETSPLFLVDQQNNRYPLHCDTECRHYIYYPYKLSLLGHLASLDRQGAGGFRIDLRGYSSEQIAGILALYEKAAAGTADDIYTLQAQLKHISGIEYTDTPFCSAGDVGA